ncbi:peroxisomal multifunctional enzyme type 2 [Stenotrophobium rhamnosiphilum]|uniref:Alcohol dehydrogenase n=1 Tax=Stenotrophobium rhamnosiphilum TaxID=2029166 RepID=A0A2T5MH40_9GAMM|nr:peroxisomal multifunctional enzyme type 2 [Stenotrophobium rhamnosiphilum]PTU31849.1 alcohol dehydrogenase [Stenotrophobium rhamnosiphilum]
MTQELRFDGKVVIVTGAGNGLGRSHALMFGARGAKVVVNDLGGGIHGGGQSSSAADKVVAEIKALGGEAVANYDSVEHGDKIVKTALDAFGTVDIVINNAGILRDVSFQKMTTEDWDLIQKVHLKGSFSVTHAAWPIMRDKGYGRVLFTTSGAGIYGNFGQANYSAAKLGIYGLASTLAIEGRSKNIHVNTIAPIAGSRLTETIMPPEMIAALKPESVSPLVGWLCHESCQETSGLFEVGASYFSKLRWERSLGHVFGTNKNISIEDVANKWEKIGDFTDAEHPTTINDTFGVINAAIAHKSLGGNQFIDLDTASSASVVRECSYDERDLSLYALGVGAGADPLDAKELALIHEANENFCALPTYAVMQPANGIVQALYDGNGGLPGLNFGFDRVLHGEMYTEIKALLPSRAKLKNTYTLKAAYDKNPHAVTVLAISTTDETGEELAYNEFTAFVRGGGGWGGDRGPSGDANKPPERDADIVIEERIDPGQALLYRLSGDTNPLHVDPAFAKSFGYDKPILQGLCSFGYIGRHLIKACCDGDPRKFKSIRVRFAETVFPGDTLVTRIWKESDTRVLFEVSVKERGKLVIKGGVGEFFKDALVRKPRSAAVAAEQVNAASPDDVFSVVAAFIAEHPDLAAKTKTSFQFNLKGPDSQWIIDLKDGAGSCKAGKLDKPDVTIDLDSALIEKVMTSTLPEIQKLYFGGKIKIGGNVAASNKLTAVLGIDKNRYTKKAIAA